MLIDIDSAYPITSAFFFKPENVMINNETQIKLNLIDDHFFTEKLIESYPLFTHVSL